MRIWKIDVDKATRILQDTDVKAAIAARRAAATVTEGDRFMVFQEGFETPEEVLVAAQVPV